MIIACLSRFRSWLVVVFFTLTTVACSSDSKKRNPDAPPDRDAADDVNVVTPPDGPGTEAGGEVQRESVAADCLTVSPTSLDLGKVPLAVALPRQTVTVAATCDIFDLSVSVQGEELTLDEIASTCGKTLATGTSCIVAVDYFARTMGAKSGSIVIAAGGQSAVVPVTARVSNLDDGTIYIYPDSATFTAGVGQTSSPVTFRIANVGDASFGPLTVTITGSGAADFTATTAGCDLVAPLGTCSITVVFTPKVAGALRTANLVVEGPGPDFPTGSAVLIGNVLTGGRLVISPTSARFPSSPVGFGVANVGDTTIGPLTVTITGPNAAAFTATSKDCDSLAPLGTCTITVVYTPSLEVDPCATDSLVVTGPAPELVTVSATLDTGPVGTPNPLRLVPPTSDLGSVAVGTTSPPVPFTLSYVEGRCSGEGSTGPLTIELSSAEFVVTDDTCSTSVLATGGTCSFGVALRPTSSGDKLTNVSVTSQAGRSAVTTVTGTGVSIDASITPPDGGVLDGSSEAQGEAGQEG